MKFCYVLPQANKVKNSNNIEVVVPNCLQMGWYESSPLFCSASESERDVIDTLLPEVNLPEQPFE